MDERARENNRLRQRRYLELHKDEVNAKRREKYHERINRGKCPRCGSKTKKDRTLCTQCCDYMLDLNRKYAQQKAEVKEQLTKSTKKPAMKKAKSPRASSK